MRVAIDLTELKTSEMGGIEVYCRDLLKEFSLDPDGNEFAVFVPEEERGNVKYERLKILTYRNKSCKKVMRVSQKLYEKLAYKIPLQSYRPDVIHVPFQVIRHQLPGIPTVLSVMDIQHEYFPEYFSKQDLDARGKLFESSMNRAQQIIAISDFTKSTIIEKYSVSAQKITVVHLSHDEKLFFPRKDKLDSLKLPKKFIFYPAATWPHKNHVALVEALSEYIKKSKDQDLKLVFAGIPKQHGGEIKKVVTKLKLTDRIHSLGYIDRSELPYVYSSALGMVYPSKFEGFGIPILEAMATGCPVACSNTTSLPEVAGNAALLFNPESSSEIAKAIELFVSDTKLRTSLRRLGIKQSKQFSRKKVADQTLDVYKKALTA